MNEILKRCKELIDRGNSFHYSDSYWISKEKVKEAQKYISSTANIIFLIAPPNSYFNQECQRIITDEKIKDGMPAHVIIKLTGLLEALKDEIELGFFKQIEYIFTASTFDDFLDHAEYFHKSNKKLEASILASVVFEDTIRKISKKNSIEESGVNMELLIDTLAKENIFTPVKAKRIKGYAAVRNKALHAQWEEFDIKDVGQLIKGTRDVIETFL